MQNREDFLPLLPSLCPHSPSLPLSLFFITTWSFQEALVFPQLILTWIRDNKQPVNGGLN